MKEPSYPQMDDEIEFTLVLQKTLSDRSASQILRKMLLLTNNRSTKTLGTTVSAPEGSVRRSDYVRTRSTRGV